MMKKAFAFLALSAAAVALFAQTARMDIRYKNGAAQSRDESAAVSERPDEATCAAACAVFSHTCTRQPRRAR